jgi:hypothetical protein
MFARENTMALFDAPKLNYPKKWKDYSIDYQLMFVYHGSMMALFMFGAALSVREELLATTLLVAVLFSLSLRHRRNMNWRWRGAGPKEMISAVGVLVLAALFDFAATPSFPPSNPRFLPWHMAGVGIAVFGGLSTLKIVQLSKADFLTECEVPSFASAQLHLLGEPIQIAPVDPTWKRTTRAIYSALFVLVWIESVASFYYFGKAFRDGSPQPTPAQTELLSDHGQVMYIPHSQKILIDFLQVGMSIGIPFILALGFILHFFVGVKLFPNTPTFEEWKKQKLKK